MRALSGSRRITLQDIAATTGYTMNTVSRALKNKPDISQNTCEYIQKVAVEMGYIRNSIASSLRSGRSRTFAVIVGGVSNPFYAIMIDTLHDLAEQIGYTMLVLCSRDTEQQERRAVMTSIERQVDGVLLFPGNEVVSSIALMRQAGLPFVIVSRHTPLPDYDSVVSDEETGGYLAGRHLIEAGHRKLVFLYTDEVLFSLENRVNGVLRAAREAGIAQEDVHRYQRSADTTLAPQLRRWKSEGITGIVAFCDIEAWKLISALESCRLIQHFAVVGFDNIQSVINFPTPLCTVDGAMREQARAAVELLVRRIEGDSCAPQSLVYPSRLVCRGSCGAHRHG